MYISEEKRKRARFLLDNIEIAKENKLKAIYDISWNCDERTRVMASDVQLLGFLFGGCVNISYTKRVIHIDVYNLNIIYLVSTNPQQLIGIRDEWFMGQLKRSGKETI